MATKKYMSLERLTEYDGLIKAEISAGDDAVKSYVDTEVAKKANSSHTHDDRYYTESEIDTKISDVNSSVTTHTNNSDIHVTVTNKTNWNSAYTHSTSAHAPSNAERNIVVGIQKNGTDLTVDSSTRKVNITVPTTAAEVGAASSDHNHDNDYDAKGAAASALDSAKTYADGKVADLLNNSTEAVDSIMELAEAMKNNADAIEALEDVAASKVPTSRKINGKALTADITLSASDVGADASGSASAVQTKLDTHASNTTLHITAAERTNWGVAYTHSQAAHAPSNAQANIIESIKVNGTAQTITSKAVNITVPTKASDIGAAASSHSHAISDITNLQTTLNNASNAISANTGSITALTDRTKALEEKVGDGFVEITSAEIQALFNS